MPCADTLVVGHGRWMMETCKRAERKPPKWKKEGSWKPKSILPLQHNFSQSWPYIPFGQGRICLESYFHCHCPAHKPYVLYSNHPIKSQHSRGYPTCVSTRPCSVPINQATAHKDLVELTCVPYASLLGIRLPHRQWGSEQLVSRLLTADFPDTDWGLPIPTLTQGLQGRSFWKPCGQLNPSTLTFLSP